MIVKRIFEPSLAQAGYLLGCADSGQAIVIDPNRDADAYLRAAAQDSLTITHVTETHIHADFLSGSRELVQRAGATVLLSDEGDADWKYGFAREARLIRHGDRIRVGSVQLDVIHTPGHTPEHVTFLITDRAVADEPIAAATGDFIFVGDVGRPDLLERAARIAGTMEQSARTLFHSLQAFKRYEDWLQIWPAHGAGSSCGKGISAVPHSTLGYERRFNWAFKVTSEADFMSNVLTDQPDPPPYFAMMKRLNKEGPRVLGSICTPRREDDEALVSVVRRGALVIDTRTAEDYAAGFIQGTLNIPFDHSFVTWAGWLVPYNEDIYLLIDDGVETYLEDAVRALSLIGLDRVAGYFSASAIARVAQAASPDRIPQVAPAELKAAIERGGAAVVDVRTDAEWREGHLPGALHIPLGQLPNRLSDIPGGRPIVVHCQLGARAAIGASVLKRAGFANVHNLAGGYAAWTSSKFKVQSSK